VRAGNRQAAHDRAINELREEDPDAEVFESSPIEVRLPEAHAEKVINGLGKTAEALRMVIADNEARRERKP
jgi:predicted RNA-binding protein YlqC (UPF0109 family)